MLFLKFFMNKKCHTVNLLGSQVMLGVYITWMERKVFAMIGVCNLGGTRVKTQDSESLIKMYQHSQMSSALTSEILFLKEKT